MATLEQLRFDLVAQLGLLPNDEFINNDELNRSINIALQRFSRMADWPWLQQITTISTVKNTALYNLPSDFDHALQVSINQVPLQATSLAEAVRYKGITDYVSGYTIQGSQLRLFPTPGQDDTLDLVYLRAEPGLNIDADTPVTPNRYSDFIVLLAAEHQATRQMNTTLLQIIQAEIQRFSKDMAWELLRTTQSPRISIRKDYNSWTW